MSDMPIWGKTIKGSFIALLLYAGADIFTSLGHDLMTMTPEDWAKMSWPQVGGYWISQVGSLFILVKAFYSNSSKT